MSPTRPSVRVQPAPTWRGRLSTPVRHVLRQLIAPLLASFVWAYDELLGLIVDTRAALDQLRSAQDRLQVSHDRLNERIAESHRRIDRLSDEIAAANALAWDQVALSRRLGELEDRLATPPCG